MSEWLPRSQLQSEMGSSYGFAPCSGRTIGLFVDGIGRMNESFRVVWDSFLIQLFVGGRKSLIPDIHRR